MNKKAQVIAFYLPQFHPIPENDEWYGKGFTEWTNVGKAKPLFRGHYQPRVPADLGYYDLRMPEVKEQQVELAKEAGISAFCYWHYWFGEGKQLLEKPLQEVVRTGKPDFPFCLAWANHSWYNKLWNSETQSVTQSILVEQKYNGIEDIRLHFETMLPMFKDERYYKIHDRLVFVVFSPKDLPYFNLMKNEWNKLARQNNIPEFFFIAQTTDMYDVKYNKFPDYDAINLSLLDEPWGGKTTAFKKAKRKIRHIVSEKMNIPLNILDYGKSIDNFCCDDFMKDNIYPTIIPNWDTSPRKSYGAKIYTNSTPELFEKHVCKIVDIIKNKSDKDKVIFLKSWNEWAEGNYMEPDLKYGKGYVEALSRVL